MRIHVHDSKLKHSIIHQIVKLTYSSSSSSTLLRVSYTHRESITMIVGSIHTRPFTIHIVSIIIVLVGIQSVLFVYRMS